MAIESINPTTGETIRTYEEMSDAAVDGAIEAADAAQREWRGTGFAERGERLRGAGDLLRRRRREYAELMTAEMGKVLAAGLSEIDKCAAACDFYAQHAAEFLAPEAAPTEASRSF